MRLTVRTLRRGWSASVEVPDGCTVGELRRVAARAADISPWSRAKIVLRGAPLADDAAVAPVRPDDTLLVASAPVPPPDQVPPAISSSSGRGAPPASSSRRDDVWDDSDDDTPEARAAPARVALRRAGVPDLLARLLVAISWRAWITALIWLALCRLSHALDLGPVSSCSGSSPYDATSETGNREKRPRIPSSTGSENFRARSTPPRWTNTCVGGVDDPRGRAWTRPDARQTRI